MRLLPLALVLLCGPAFAGVFPYPVHKRTLANGLDLVVIETPEFKDVLSYNTMVLAGSGREEEAGKTGLAHLFEHILFRHRYAGEEGGYDDRMSKLGTHNNAWTWFDVTYYHPLTFASNLVRAGAADGLPGLAELESARFKGLDFTEKTFKTETGAVLGEYRRGASRPSFKLSERAMALLFPNHPYGHTTMGFLPDVVDMPNHFEAAKKFYDAFYRPNNCVVVVAGDVKAEQVFSALEPRYSDWQRREIPPVRAKGEAPLKELREHAGWDADVAPLAWVAYRMPAFRPGTPESAAAAVLEELLVSPAAPLYKRLRYEKQSVSELGFQEGTSGFESADPRALIVGASLYKEKFEAKRQPYFDEVVGDIIGGLDELKSFSKQPGADGLLQVVKKKYRYDFLNGLASPERIAATFALYYRFTRETDVLDRHLAAIDALTPEDVDRLASAAFKPENQVVLTLAYEGKK